MALVMMALLFLLQQRHKCRDEHPLLNCRDLKILLAHILPSRDASLEEIIQLMNQRHQRRQAATDSAYRQQRARDGTKGRLGNLTK